MTVQNGTFKTRVSKFMDMIDRRIRSVFNRDFFGVYEGTIEVVNDAQATLNVSIPALNNAMFENCRVTFPILSASAKLAPTFIVGTHVLVAFTSFNLYDPMVIGQVSPIDTIHSALNASEINIVNGAGSIRMGADGVINIIGTSLTLNGSSIILSGDTITANGEDLTNDDIGEL